MVALHIKAMHQLNGGLGIFSALAKGLVRDDIRIRHFPATPDRVTEEMG